VIAAIQGSGVGAAAAAAVLLGAGWRVLMSSNTKNANTRPHWILLNVQTLELLHSVFGTSLKLPVRGDLWGRLVLAQPGLPGRLLAARSAVLRADELEEALVSSLCLRYASGLSWADAERPGSNFDVRTVPWGGARVVTSGSRQAWQLGVELTAWFDHSVFETVPRGWLYLSPIHGRKGVLHCVTCEGDSDSVHAMLAESREIGPRIGSIENCYGPFAASAEFAYPEQASATLPCSQGIFRWDPICGDGTGASIRSALLAAAGVKAIQAGADISAVRDHVITRSAVAFGSHVATCENLYESSNFDRSWHFDLQALRAARDEMQRYDSHTWRFELRNLELCPSGVPSVDR
jgi:hypothetical protein